MVEVLIDLAAGTVLDKETAKDTKTAHPDNLTMRILALPISNPQLCL